MEEKYKETLGILIVILAIIAFMVTTADYVMWKEKPYMDNTKYEMEDIKYGIFQDTYVKCAVVFIWVFFLYIINKNFLIKRGRIIFFTKCFSLYIAFILFGLYVNAVQKESLLGTFFGLLLYTEPQILEILARVINTILFWGYTFLSIINLLSRFRKKSKKGTKSKK